MPELPEVETMRRLVERNLVGKTITSQALTLPKLVRDSPLTSLEPIVGQTVLAARRRAKVLMIDMTADISLMLHFKLAGQLAILLPDGQRAVAGHPVPKPDGDYPHKSTHWTLSFDDGTIAYYSDIRQFGWIRLLLTDDVASALTELSFGPEAIGPDGITIDDLAGRLQRRSIPIKQALLDQGVLAGLGNIYVDESLHASQIHPARPARDLTAVEVTRLHPAIAWALEQGIAQGGAKIIHSRAYPIGGFPAVHARAGEPCGTCGTSIEKTRVGGRGTYYCPICQPVRNMADPALT